MQFIEVNGDMINLSHVVKVEQLCEPLKSGDWAVKFTLTGGMKAYRYDVSYQASNEAYEAIKKILIQDSYYA